MQRLHRAVFFVVERMAPRVVEPAREQQVGQLRDEIVEIDLVEQVAGVFGVAEFHGSLLTLNHHQPTSVVVLLPASARRHPRLVVEVHLPRRLARRPAPRRDSRALRCG